FVRITSLQEAGTPDARASVKIRAQSVRLGASLCRLRQSEPRRGYLFAWIEGPPPGRAKSHTRGSPNPGIFWNQNRLLGNARRQSDRKILRVKHSRRDALSGGHRDRHAPALRGASAQDDARARWPRCRG